MLWQPTRGIFQPNQHWRRGQAGGLATVLNATPDIQSTGWNGFTMRNRILRAGLVGVPGGATQIRITVQGGTSEGTQWSKSYVGLKGGTDGWDAAALTQVLWGGSSGSSVAANTQLSSDVTAFSDDGSSDLIITFHFNSGAADNAAELDGFTNAVRYHKAAVDEAATANVSGYTTTPTRLAFNVKIEMG